MFGTLSIAAGSGSACGQHRQMTALKSSESSNSDSSMPAFPDIVWADLCTIAIAMKSREWSS